MNSTNEYSSMSSKSLWAFILVGILLVASAIVWYHHHSRLEAKNATARDAPNIQCALGCTDEPIPRPNHINNVAPLAQSAPLAQTNTCLDAITDCLGKNGELGQCTSASQCNTACKNAIIQEVLPLKNNRLDKLHDLFILPNGVCNTP